MCDVVSPLLGTSGVLSRPHHDTAGSGHHFLIELADLGVKGVNHGKPSLFQTQPYLALLSIHPPTSHVPIILYIRIESRIIVSLHYIIIKLLNEYTDYTSSTAQGGGGSFNIGNI